MRKRKQLNITKANCISTSQQQLQSNSLSEQQQVPLETELSPNETPQQFQQPSTSCIAKQRKVRGPTRMADIWDLNDEERVVVKLNDQRIPIGKEATKLTRFIGSMMRMPNFAPITYTTWHEFPDSTKEEIWKVIESKFAFELLHSYDGFKDQNTIQMVKSWITSDMSTKWRQWKNFLKSKYYDEDKTVEEMTAKVDDARVDKQQFFAIATYWLTNKAKEQSETNRTNRSKSDEPHCAGTRSFPTIIHTLTEESNGVPPSRAEIYIRTRTRKDGSVVNEKVASAVELMKKGLSESNSQDLQSCSWENDVYSQVKGPEKRGRIRCMGTMSTSSSKFGPSCSQAVYHNEEVQGLKAEVQGLKEALSTVISLFQKQFPNENMEILNNVTRVVHGEVPDASSAKQTPHMNNHSPESSHQANQNASSDAF